MMMALGFITMFIFNYVPLSGLYMAFSDYSVGQGIFSGDFVGFKHVKEFVLDSVDLIHLLRNTLVMNVLTLITLLSGAMFLAILINEIRMLKFKKIVQTSTFFPFFISWVIVYSIFHVFLATESGVINIALEEMGIIEKGISFMTNPKYSWGLIVCTNLWKMLGYNSVLFLASIASINPNLYEAANIDGADRIQSIWHITLPSLMPTLQVLLILNVGFIFKNSFEQFYLFTNIMNRPTMEVFDMFVYRVGLKELNFSYATAAGMCKSLAGVITIVFVNWLSKKTGGKGIF